MVSGGQIACAWQYIVKLFRVMDQDRQVSGADPAVRPPIPERNERRLLFGALANKAHGGL